MFNFFKKKSQNIKVCNVPLFTYEAWKQAYPNLPYSTWESISQPGNILGWADSIYNGMKNKYRVSDDAVLRTIVMDKQYIQWLKANNKKACNASENLYLNGISKESAEYAFNSTNFGKGYTLFGIACVLLTTEPPQDSEVTLSQETKESLQKDIDAVYGEGNAYVPGYLLEYNAFFNKEKRSQLVRLAECHFENGIDADIAALHEQKYQNLFDANPTKPTLYSLALFIPYLVKHELSDIDIKVSDLNDFFSPIKDTILSDETSNFISTMLIDTSPAWSAAVTNIVVCNETEEEKNLINKAAADLQEELTQLISSKANERMANEHNATVQE